MSRSSGPGSPLFFRCGASRKVGASGNRHEVTLTGRSKFRKPDGAVGVRHGHVMVEYRCNCGHVGWSAHLDLTRRALREAKR